MPDASMATWPAGLRTMSKIAEAGAGIGRVTSMRSCRNTVSGTEDSSVELQGGALHELLPLVGGVDGADGARLRAHHHRLRARAVAPVAHALEQVAVADAGGAEEHVVARDEIVAGEHLVEVVAGVERGLLLFLVARVQPTEHLAAHALERGRGDHTLRRATDAEEDVGAAPGRGDGDGGGDVAVLDELDAGAGLAALADDVLVSGTVEHHRGDVVDVLALRLGHRFEVGL